jgi:CheY-like chemotaxis protein
MALHTSTAGNQPQEVPPIILLVEDDQDTRDMYSLVLESRGLWVATAADPGAATTAVAELKPDLIVTDVGFQGAALGLEFAHAIKHDEATAHVPIVLLSGRGPDDIPASARADADLLLVKPVLPDDLVLHIGTLLQKSRALRDRNEASRKRTAELVQKSNHLIAKSSEINRRLEASSRRCPACAQALHWVEAGRIDGIEYDYYHWCDRGCGLFCFDRSGDRWIKLAG